MSEYIIEWFGIGAQLTDLFKSHVPPYLWPKRIREERRREKVVRCRDCAYICNREYANGLEFHTCSYFDSEHAEIELDGFCAWAERNEKGKCND